MNKQPADVTLDASVETAELCQAALAMGWSLSPDTAAHLVRYLDLLERWNAVYNLTAIRDRRDMRLQHLVDCLAIVAPLRRVISQRPDTPKRLLDVGSGGGLPGVVLALLFADWSVVCVDSVQKKVSFVQHVAAQLGIANLDAVHARVEKLLAPPCFGIVTSRAFSALGPLVGATRHCLDDLGVYMAMKAKVTDAELSTVPSDIDVFHVEQLNVPGLDAARCIVWMSRAVLPTARG